MTSSPWGKYCDGGHYCSAPKECCPLGCCYHPLPPESMFSVWFLGHWYFWALVTIILVLLLCICSLWRRCVEALRCLCCSTGRDERASEPDSTGSCYAPPHYSRCSSFHHAPPPPYAEVASKPDLYPLVISYNGDTGMKRGGSASYLMVQYFRNYILRPSGSISATSTIDSLSSSFLCNAANEANTVIPPPYSCTGSLEGFSITASNTAAATESQILHSASSLTCNDYSQHSPHHPAIGHVQQNGMAVPTPSDSPSQHYSTHSSPKRHSHKHSAPNGQTSNSPINKPKAGSNYSPIYIHNKTTSFVNSMPNSRFDYNEVILSSFAKLDRNSDVERRTCDVPQQLDSCCQTNNKQNSHTAQKSRKTKMSTENSLDSETSQGEEHNFSELLNLSVCAPTSIINCDISALTGTEYETSQNLTELQQSYSIANSVTVSDISSLANLGTPDSPPRATSPTVEIRELLDKIQQLPQQKSPAPEVAAAAAGAAAAVTANTVNGIPQAKNNRFFVKSKSKTLYMPLNTSTNKHNIIKLSPSSKHSGSIFCGTSGIFSGKAKRGWLSRSAPSTPCGNMVPLFPSQRRTKVPKSQMGSRSKVDDSSALLTEYDGSEDDQHNNTNELL